MRALGLFSCVALTACSFGAPGGSGDKPDGAPGGPDTPPADASQCIGSGLGKVCLKTVPTSARMLMGSIDTGMDAMCDELIMVTGTETCVIAGTDVTIMSSKTYRATGTRPLMIVASNMIDIAGDLDVSSKRGETSGGAGAQTTLCPGVQAAQDDDGGGGGGAGGSFGGAGGDGGNGDLNNNGAPGGPGIGSKHAAAFVPTVLRAGCRGSNGGNGGGTLVGLGGLAGGAVYLIAGATIQIAGHVVASGAAGGAGFPQDGGGGGGSGGMIGLDATDVVVSGFVAANGGGGGEGGGLNDGTNGTNGTNDATRAAGGSTGDVDGGDGGEGSGGITAPADLVGANGASANGGGGGGGGGAGFIYVIGRLMPSGGTISPPPTVN
jgi:hypothetical protein